MSVLTKSVIAGAGYGVFGGLGLACLFLQYTMAVFHERHLYPNLAPFTLAAGTVSLLVCLLLLTWNVWFLQGRPGKEILRWIGVEVLIAIPVVFLSFWGWNWLIDWIGALF